MDLLALLKKISALERAPKTSKGDYPAAQSPYKPILLLTVLWRIQQNAPHFSENTLRFDLCCKDFEKLYSSLYGPPSSAIGGMATQAFWYLGSGKPRIWELVPNEGQSESLRVAQAEKLQVKTASKLNQMVASARFADPDWALLQDSDVQQSLISFLISRHFTDVRRELERL